MKWIRNILLPIVPIYYAVTWLRNLLYDKGIKSSKVFNFPIVCVGNLSTGGTGKTPMVEYLIRLLKDDYDIATLSRGYGRSTKGYILANEKADANSIGDEPFQFYSKFRNIRVAVDSNRVNGIINLMQLKPNPDIILLDDAFQHRKVKAGFNILLTAYDNLFYNDFVLPTGNLREPRKGYKRADLIVVTKCPENLNDNKKSSIIAKIKPLEHQEVYFSSIIYSSSAVSESKQIDLIDLEKFTLVTGIANPKPLVNYLKSFNLDFDHLNYSDHHSFSKSDLEKFYSKKLILTTEKDYMRLKGNNQLKGKLFYLPIEIEIDEAVDFNKKIKALV